MGHDHHGALARLALALLVDAQPQRVLGRIRMQADDVAKLLDEEQVGRELEALGAMRLQPKQLEVAVHAGGREAGLAGNRSHVPVRGPVGRFGVQRLVDQFGHTPVVDCARLAGAQYAVQAFQTPCQEAGPPFADCRARPLQSLGDHATGLTRGRRQHDAGVRRQRRR
jgi:hypothetical protein